MPTLFITRDDWRARRDAAGIKQGYTKASMGDLLDKMNALIPTEGANLKIAQVLAKIDPKGVGERAAAAAIETYVACREYVQKLEKDNKLGQVSPDLVLATTSAPPMERLVGALNQTAAKCLDVVVKFHKEDALAKAWPAARDEMKKSIELRDGRAIVDRVGWRKHREDAGLPAHYVDSSIGDLLEAYKKALKDTSKGDALTTASANLIVGAVKYWDKLNKEKKVGKPKMDVVVKDLRGMVHCALYSVHDHGDPTVLQAKCKAANVSWSPILLA